MRKLSTHQVVRLSCWIDAIEANRHAHRRCASIAWRIGKRVQATYWSDLAMRAESVLIRLRERLSKA